MAYRSRFSSSSSSSESGRLVSSGDSQDEFSADIYQWPRGRGPQAPSPRDGPPPPLPDIKELIKAMNEDPDPQEDDFNFPGEGFPVFGPGNPPPAPEQPVLQNPNILLQAFQDNANVLMAMDALFHPFVPPGQIIPVDQPPVQVIPADQADLIPEMDIIQDENEGDGDPSLDLGALYDDINLDDYLYTGNPYNDDDAHEQHDSETQS